MDYKNGTTARLLLQLLLLLVFSLITESVNALGAGTAGEGEIMCIEKERRTLLRFKQALEDDAGVLSSWGSEEKNKECCRWGGVTCSNTTHRVISLQLQDKGLYGNITGALLDLHDLDDISHLDLSGNKLQGELPTSFGSLGLKYLNLSDNQFTGSVPDFSSKFIIYQAIDISSNNFSGFFPSFHPNLTVLYLSSNMFRGPISSICTYERLRLLDLSDNQLYGELPPCWMNMSRLMILDLANNNLSGKIPYSLSSWPFLLEALVLRDNNFSGELPPSLKYCKGLSMVDVWGNQLTGIIPTWMGTHLTHLKMLSLQDNKFHGIIPLELCHCTGIRVLDLSGNNISGRIPQCFSNFTSLSRHDRVGEGLLPFLSWSSSGDPILNTSSYVGNVIVNWKKKETECRTSIRFLKLIDLSNKKLVGSIPHEFSLMKGLISLNLSMNYLTGNIDSNIGEMKRLESLDLSKNQLCGQIPIGLAQLNFLSVLDLSNNNLSGSIPSGTQLQGFDASAYAGNDGLCGRPLHLCPFAVGPPGSLNNNGEHNYFDAGFYIMVASGFVLGFLGAILVTLFWNKI